MRHLLSSKVREATEQTKMSTPLLFKSETSDIETRDVGEDSSSYSTQDPVSTTIDSGITTSLYNNETSSVYAWTTIPTSDASTNSTLPNLTTTTHANTSHGEAATAIGVIVILAVVSLLLILLLCYLKRRGKLNKLPCFRSMSRSRRSSSSSRHALEEHEVMENDIRPKPEGQSDDRFAIDDLENAADPQEGREEYYYDEVFGQSEFEDEATNNAMRELYNNRPDVTEEEMLDFDFETLGIRITDYGPDIDRKNTV